MTHTWQAPPSQQWSSSLLPQACCRQDGHIRFHASSENGHCLIRVDCRQWCTEAARVWGCSWACFQHINAIPSIKDYHIFGIWPTSCSARG